MEKLFRLLMLLSGNKSYTREEIINRFDISERSVYRYLNQIEDCGFVLDRTDGRYRLVQNHSETRDLKRLLHFSEEEAFLFYKLLDQWDGSEGVANRLIRKFHSLYDFRALQRLKVQDEFEKVHQLSQAIKNKKQAYLQQYHSSSSDTIIDRKVEPFEFMADYKAVWCFDSRDKTNKQFKLSRIEKVEISTISWFYEGKHQVPFTDVFRMSAQEPIATVEMILKLKAYNLLREEYPLAEKYITKEENKFHLTIPVADFHGIGRFVLGLPGYIKVVGPTEFKYFLKKMIKRFDE